MRAYWIRKVGDATVLERREVSQPQLKGREMLVRVRAASINRGDIMARIQLHSADAGRPAGVDGAGKVVDSGASGFSVGDRVMFRGHGCFAEYTAVDPGLANLLPDNLSYEQGTAIPSAFITAWEGLIEYGKAVANEWVLLCGASSGVGVASLQTAKHLGAKVIATSGSRRKLEVLKSLGADDVAEGRGSAFVDEVMRITLGKGVDLSLNMVGGTAFPGCVQVAAARGRIIMVGYVDGQLVAPCDLEAVHGRRLEIAGIANSTLTLHERALATQGFTRDLMSALASGAIRPVIDRVFPFDELPAAKAYVETDQLIGKVVITIA